MTRFKKRAFGLAGIAVGLLTMSGAVNAATIIYTFNETDVGAFGAGPYGTVQLSTSGTGVAFTVTLRNDLNFVNTGNHSVFSFNALGVATNDVSNVMFNGFAVAGYTVVTPGTNPPFGNGTFTLMIDCTVAASCANGAPGQQNDPLTFTVANAALTDFGFLATDTTSYFAADVICTDTKVQGSCNGATGAIGVTGPGTPGDDDETDLPEPGTLALLGLGLMGLGMSRRRVAK